MNFFSILVIAVGLGMDALSVAIGVGAAARKTSPWPVLRMSLSFGLFQFFMPLIGWAAGRTVADLIARYDHWVAFLLLAGVGGKMIWESFHEKDGSIPSNDPTKGMNLLLLSVATSIDALAVGLSLAFLNIPILGASALIGVVCFLMTASGMVFGRKLGGILGRRAELIGGLVLIGIGIKILTEHLS